MTGSASLFPAAPARVAALAWRARRRMPAPDGYAHGTRARYVCGCRCQPCRGANARRLRERDAVGQALAREISAPPTPAPQLWTAPDGSKRIRVYARACPGVHGLPCPIRAHLRKDSKGGVCRACRGRLTWDGLVDAERARAHLFKLSRAGIGYKAVAAAADVAISVVAKIRSGERARIRASTERRILEVDRGAAADHTTVPARRTWRLIARLLEEGFTKAELARRLGYRTPALQFRRWRVLAATAMRVEQLYQRCMA